MFKYEAFLAAKPSKDKIKENNKGRQGRTGRKPGTH